MSEETHPDFERLDTEFGYQWRHRTRPYFIIFYEYMVEKGKCGFYLYQGVEPMPDLGVAPWSEYYSPLNGRNIGAYKTLQKAMESLPDEP